MAERSVITNPYIAGNPVTGQEMFFGREDVFEFVRRALIGRHQDNIIVLYGQRRTGKTSVLYQMHRHIEPRYIPVLIDLQALSMEGIATFLREIAIFVSRALQRDHGIRLERPRQEDFADNPRGYFQEVFLNRVWEAIEDRHLLLMFDETARLEDRVQGGHLERDVFDYLRHLMQHNSRLSFIFSLARIHRRRASGQCPEAARGCSCESGIMVSKQQSRPQNKEHPIDATTQPSRSHPNRV